MNALNDPQNPLRDQIRVDVREIEPDLTPEQVTEQQLAREEEQPYDGGGWPGDGSGTDDLADLMAHGDEGCCDGPGDY